MDWVRTGLNISVGRWKALLIAFCLFSATVMAIETVAAVATFARGTEGRLGVRGEGVMHDGRAAVSVTGFEPWSLAPQAGMRVGDLMLRNRWVDGGRHLRPGESIAVTLVRDGVAVPAQITAAERPIDALERWHFGLSAVLCWSGTLLGLVIGLRQAGSSTSRALSLAFLWWSANLGWGYAPAYWPAAVVSLTQAVALAPGWYLGLWFAIHYPDERPQGLRRALRRALPLFLVALVAVELAVVAWALDRGSQALFSWTQLPYIGAAGVLMLVAFWDGWRRSSGEQRQRFSWLLGSFALMWAVSYSTWLGDMFSAEVAPWLGRVSVVGSLAALCGLTYAILRHRVLDMGLALNRSLVFAVVGAVLLGSFQFLNVLAGRLLHFDDPAKAGLLTAVLAGFVVLAYPKVKPRAEWLVDRLFFREWVAREADLARFAADARGFTEASALTTALGGALDRFTTGAGAALYVRNGDGRFARQPGATIDAPDMLDADEPLAVALRAGHSVATCDDVHSTLPGELAIVLSRQRDLDAFMLIGRQRDGRALRSDEVVALRDALRTAGVEWQALRWEALQRQAARSHAAASALVEARR
ncbi:MAG TPA: hypothetical protein VM845_04195 [Burkholderiaceae bacterium]|nr:hypothetical protein [Burkholderiaceae bacterium]